MKTKKHIWLVCLATGLYGCGEPPLPELNDQNCRLEEIKKISNAKSREQFMSMCSRRVSPIAPTENPKNWLDLTAPPQKR